MVALVGAHARACRYIIHVISHFVLLALVTTEVLSDYSSVSILDWYTLALTIGIVSMSVQQLALACELGGREWYTNPWNRGDLVTYVLFYFSLTLKLCSSGSTRSALALYAKFGMVLVLLFLFLRFFRFYYLQVCSPSFYCFPFAQSFAVGCGGGGGWRRKTVLAMQRSRNSRYALCLSNSRNLVPS